jgi:putative FmdB family regulatory protein
MPIYNFHCPSCDWAGEMLVRSYNDAPPSCPSCGAITKRLFSPTTSLFIAESYRSENVDAVRRYADRLERDESLRRRERRAQEIARKLYERLNAEPTVSGQTMESIVEAGRVK